MLGKGQDHLIPYKTFCKKNKDLFLAKILSDVIKIMHIKEHKEINKYYKDLFKEINGHMFVDTNELDKISLDISNPTNWIEIKNRQL